MGKKIELGTDFSCDFSVMSPEEHQRHTSLIRELFDVVRATQETQDGFLFEFPRSDGQLLKIAEWATLENRCCPFFHFSIDLKPQSDVIEVGLAGPSGSKDIIRSYLNIQPVV